MRQTDLRPESVNFQWNFYERAINNYSIIIRMLHYVEQEDSLINNIPRIFVEGSPFDMCKVVKHENGTVREGFFSMEESLNNVDFESIRALSEGATSPSVVTDIFGYGVLYIYPLKKDLDIIGFLLLGKRVPVDLDRRTLRELEIVCDIYNKSLILHANIHNHQKVTESRTAFENLVEEFPDALLMIDKNGSIVFANKRAKSEFEGGKGLLVGEKIDNIVSGIGPEFYKKDTALRGEVKYKSGDKYKIFRMDSFSIKEARDKGVWRAVILKDVVEKKIKEEEHISKEKMESMGMLAGGIAHDFNNLLTGVLGYASLIKNFLSNEEKLYRYAEAIESSAQRAAKLAQHLLNFSRRQRKVSGVVDLNMLMEDILFLIKESFRDIEMEKSFDPRLYPIKGDEAELQNVFLNICTNAKDAMAGKGMLRVRTERKRYVGHREFALIEIADTGKGIDEEIREKIFEPYFTTKENGTNLGMGLYLVDKIIREHGGFVELESEKGKGTKFSIYLPLPARVIPQEPVKEEKNHDILTRRQKILLVDDEDVVRDLIKGVLTDEPADILEAANGTEALNIFREQHAAIDLVILDMIMPGIKGDEVLREMRNIRKDVKVIISSGYMSEEQRESLKKYKVDGFLDKPFRDKDVIHKIIEVLSRK
ncbi:MAG: Blue-light-activated protein [Syntrophorhabdus sp. PtaU1.Bin153]|nr:MAG: Blue-light-activated protein [Syntrophorhabdus sp. PtaU1.Bin153]